MKIDFKQIIVVTIVLVLFAIVMLFVLKARVVYGAEPIVTQTVSFKLSWQDNATNEEGFRLYRCQGTIETCGPADAKNAKFTRVKQLASANLESTTDSITNDTGGNSYCYYVSAYNVKGESRSGVACAVTATIIVVPNAPAGLIAVIVGTEIISETPVTPQSVQDILIPEKIN
jgi:hypothetical protein